MATKLYSEDKVTIIDSNLEKSTLLGHNLDLKSDENFESFFEIERIVKWIADNGFKRTALQLPDGFLAYAYRLSSTIEGKCKDTKIYILADTSYRSCCIDDVAAQHANCDSLIHFGESCLSKTTERIPILYIFGKFPLDIGDFCEKWNNFLEKNDLTNTTIYLLCDSTFSHCQDELNECLKSKVVSLKLADHSSNEIVLGRSVPGFDDESKKLLIFVGSKETKLLPIWLMTFPFFNQYVHYVPDAKTLSPESSATSRLLRKRLFLIEQMRDANVIGCIVGALEIKGYKDAIQRVRQLCKAANKKLYVLSIGKLNEPKLSNFASDIDAFIMLSCPFGVVLDFGEFYKPIVSMFEAEIALNSSKEWFANIGWTAEFNNFANDEIKVDLEKTTVSLITGKLRATQIVEDDDPEVKNKQIITYSAGDYYANRSWKGLDDSYNQEASTEVKKGLTGTSMGYSSEK